MPVSSNYSFRDVWQTWLGRRGDVARAMFYMNVRYEGGRRGGAGKPDLQLTGEIENVSNRNVIDIGRPSRAFPVTPPGVRVRTTADRTLVIDGVDWGGPS